MYEIDFLPVGDGEKSGDAIAMRFTRPDNGELAHVIIDGGFQDDGDALVGHVQKYYDTDFLDLVVLTHPDGDHIGGLGTVVRELQVGALLAHRPALHSHGELPAAKAVEELVAVAHQQGTRVYEPSPGLHAFDGALLVAGPDLDYYMQLLDVQALVETTGKAAVSSSRLLEALRHAGQRFVATLPVEIPFDDAGGTNPRNNTSVIISLELPDHRFLFTGDAGVPALNRALGYLEGVGRNGRPPDFVQIPHHGSRHNIDTQTLDRMLGSAGQPTSRIAIVSVTAVAPKHPSPRVVNAFMRRGCHVLATASKSICHNSPGSCQRIGWGPAPPLQPMDESVED